ncbi:MAG: SSS family solute:Na+ symporter [Mariniblastus sp.]|jgi:SSS family solute:Na+ symporter
MDRRKQACFILTLVLIGFSTGQCFGAAFVQDVADATDSRLQFEAIPDLPEAIGVAGPIVGVHNDVLIVAGGANFATSDAPDLWDVPKAYHDRTWVLEKGKSQSGFQWRNDTESFRLKEKVAYSAVVSTEEGVLCMGGEDAEGPVDRAFLLSWDGAKVVENDLGVPNLPLASTSGGAAIIGRYVYLVAGQTVTAAGDKAASRTIWRLNLDLLETGESAQDIDDQTQLWEPVLSWPDEGARRMFPLVTVQHDGFRNRLYVIGGRRFLENADPADLRNLKFASDAWSFDPTAYDPKKFNASSNEYEGESPWKQIANAPVPMTAGTAVPFGPAHIVVPAYATGEALGTFLDSVQEMRDYAHPGFPKTAYAYHTITDTWTSLGAMPVAQVTTPAVRWGDDIFLISGEVRPRVRSAGCWKITVKERPTNFGWLNMSVVAIYLLAMLGIGVFFTFRNKTTDDFFRGGKNMPWWAAGCSIFATMLSSITYMAVPAKAFAQDWVYAMGNVLILAVAPIAIYVALPFFRRIDATSAYEYLERRFNRAVRLVGSGSFSLFHIFRMGVVLALAAMALASVTPLTPAQCVIVMGLLSIVYCTLGGIEAVIWTDTVQTVILIGGAILCIYFALSGSATGSWAAAVDAQKFHAINLDFGPSSFTTMAIWVVVIGGFGQNLASYTADQAVVQRYMTTPDQRLAAKSIWLNGFMAIPAAGLFFGMGTAFWMFYRSHPDKLDPTIAADRIMPLFISQELPVGLAGLVVAGIFAAAQSTVSTSMNSGATTIVTDFFRPLNICKSEKAYLWAARSITLVMGLLGMAAGLLFIDPSIKSLFDQFIGILGMFLGVLAGLFALGATTRRANGIGSLVGALVAMTVMVSLVFAANDKSLFGLSFRQVYDSMGSNLYQVSGYLYAFIGIAVCYIVGYLASCVIPSKPKPLDGLTLFDAAKD